MAAFIVRKKLFLVFISAFVAAAGIVVLLYWLLEGPRLGPHYDFLLEHRKGSAPAPELLIVDSGDFLEPDTAARMILTLIEMDADSLVIQTPILGFSPGRINSGEEIRSWFEEEFSLMERNIRNLFEAIRVGSIAPGEARRYVDELVGLTDQGKERLTAALVRQDQAGIARLEQTITAFGRVYRAGDLRPSPGGNPEPAGQSYSRPQADWDGRVRRAALVERPGGPEHVVYGALKNHFIESRVETIGTALFLINTLEDGDHWIPLDSRGNLLFETPAGDSPRGPWSLQDRNEDFRRIPLETFTAYQGAEETLQRLLREADKLGIYSVLEPERSPPLLYDYAQTQREEFLVSSNPGNPAAQRFSGEWKIRWLQTRAEYFGVLEEFLYGSAEESLKAGYEELLGAEDLGKEAIRQITALRDGLSTVFDGLRDAYRELWLLRETLSQALDRAFIILGPREDRNSAVESSAAGFFRFLKGAGHTDSEISFILADNILRGRGIGIPGRLPVLLCSFLVIGVELLVLVRLGPLPSLGLGCIFSLAIGVGFSWAFIVWGRWIDPLIPFTASLAATLTTFLLNLFIVRRGARRFRLAYGPYVGKPCLRQLIRAGRPAPALRLSTQAAIIAVRQTGLLALEDQGGHSSLAGARAVESFREEASAVFKKAGGVIIGCEGDLVLACFGSPLERIGMGPGQDPYVRYSHTPALRAAEFVTEIAGEERAARWKFGIDTGECTFGYLPVAGYCGYGRPVVRARILSGLNPRYNTRVLVSESVRSQIKDIPVRKLRMLKEQDGSGGEAFYELVFTEGPAPET
jgi:class 3 adenylate cyclase